MKYFTNKKSAILALTVLAVIGLSVVIYSLLDTPNDPQPDISGNNEQINNQSGSEATGESQDNQPESPEQSSDNQNNTTPSGDNTTEGGQKFDNAP